MSAAAAAAAAAAEESTGDSGGGDVWTLRLMGPASASHLAKFEETFVKRGSERVSIGAPPLDDASFCKPPVYMYCQQEVDELSEDEEGEAALAKRATEKWDPSVRRRRRRKGAAEHWVVEDARDFIRENGVRYVGDKVASVPSKYVLLEAESETMTVRVTPVDEWWNFKRPLRAVESKMTVQDAELQMKAASRGRITNKALAKRLSDRESADAAIFDTAEDPGDRGGAGFERRRLPPGGGGGGGRGRGRGRGRGSRGSGRNGDILGGGSDGEEDGPGSRVVGLGVAGEDLEEAGKDTGVGEHGNDYDEEFSDDDGNEGGDDGAAAADAAGPGRNLLYDSEEEAAAPGAAGGLDASGRAIVEIKKKFDDEDDDDDGMDSPTAADTDDDEVDDYRVSKTAKRGTDAVGDSSRGVGGAKRAKLEDGDGAAAAAASSAGETLGGREAAAPARAAAPEFSRDLTEEMVVAELRRKGGKMPTHEVIATFKPWLGGDRGPHNQKVLKIVLTKVATRVDDVIMGKGFQLKPRYMDAMDES